MCRGRASSEDRDVYILFLFFLSFIKTPYLKILYFFVLSCRDLFFHIYYTKYQAFIQCTNFVQKRTIRTKTHKIAFRTEYKDFVPNSAAFCTLLTT